MNLWGVGLGRYPGTRHERSASFSTIRTSIWGKSKSPHDLLAFATTAGVNRHDAQRIMGRVFAAVSKWRDFADEAGVDERKVKQIASAHRTHLDLSRGR